MSDAWRTALFDDLRGLGRWTQGRFVPELTSADEVVPAERYLDPDFLRRAVDRGKFTTLIHRPGSSADDEVDPRVAVSKFTRIYAACVSHVALCGLARGVGIDVSLARCRMVIRYDLPFAVAVEVREDELVLCDERAAAWPVASARRLDSLAELRDLMWRTLYAEHLVPIFDACSTVVKVSGRLKWSNAAEAVGILSDAAEEYLGREAARPFVADRHALLGAPRIPGVDGANPMSGLLEWVPYRGEHYTDGVQTRSVCCLQYLSSDRLGRLCQNCEFLPLEDRVALVKERHGLSQSDPRGPAEERAIAIGMEKLGLTARA
jgi:hypothetical protein